METIGVFGVSGHTIGVWVVVFMAFSGLATALYRLNAVVTGRVDAVTAGAFAIVVHLLGIVMGMLALISWWTSPSSFRIGFWSVLAALLGISVVLVGPVLAGRFAARLK